VSTHQMMGVGGFLIPRAMRASQPIFTIASIFTARPRVAEKLLPETEQP